MLIQSWAKRVRSRYHQSKRGCIIMNTTLNARLARYIFGQFRLIDLWEEFQLEGFMKLNGIERMTAGLNEARSHVEFLSPEAERFVFEATTVIKLDGLTVTFTAPAQNGTGPAYTLVLNRVYKPMET